MNSNPEKSAIHAGRRDIFFHTYSRDIPNDVARTQDVLEAQLRIRRVRTSEMPQLDIRDYTTYDVISLYCRPA